MQSLEEFLRGKQSKQTKEEHIIRYYEYARKEIEREDEITFKRLSLILIFQGFLFTAFAFVVSRARQCLIMDDKIGCVDVSEFFFISFVLCISGIFVSVFYFHGIDASKRSLLWTKDQWIRFNRINGNYYPHLLPQLTKRSDRHSFDHLANDRRRLTSEELLDGNYFGEGKKRLLYKDHGWDFSLSIPVLLMVLWSVFALITGYQIRDSVFALF